MGMNSKSLQGFLKIQTCSDNNMERQLDASGPPYASSCDGPGPLDQAHWRTSFLPRMKSVKAARGCHSQSVAKGAHAAVEWAWA